MSKNEKANVTDAAAAVIAAAEEQNLLKEPTVPAQANPENESVDEQDGTPDLTLIEGGKKSIGVRLKSLAEKAKANKKGIIITLAVVGATAVTIAKFAAKTVVEEVIDSSEAKFEEAYSDKDSETQEDAPAEA